MKNKKNDIYIELLMSAIPYIRNKQTQSKISKATDRSCFYEAELVHNLAITILDPEFSNHDICFLNNQAKYYCDNCGNKISPCYDKHIALIKKLFSLIPNDLKDNLLWGGPS